MHWNDPVGTAEAGCALLRSAGIHHLDLSIGHDVFNEPVATTLRSFLGGTAPSSTT
jgi:hypothetical protein